MIVIYRTKAVEDKLIRIITDRERSRTVIAECQRKSIAVLVLCRPSKLHQLISGALDNPAASAENHHQSKEK